MTLSSQNDAGCCPLIPGSASSSGNRLGNQDSAGAGMARGRHLLTARAVQTIKTPGRHADGDGLYLLVRERGGALEKLWLFRYRRGGRGQVTEHTLSLGPARDVSLVLARDIAGRCRALLADGGDPRDAVLKSPSRITPTFGEVADGLIETLISGFKNDKHAAQWRSTMGDEKIPALRRLPIDQIGTDDVLSVLSPMWLSTPETASRIRGRIERVLDSATAKGLRTGENPARWRGHLKMLLPKQQAFTRGHHLALPWKELPAFMGRLRRLESVSALALEWTILTAVRTNESARAPRSEIDREAKVWTIPGERMKAGKPHTVPLCNRCLEIFDEIGELESAWLFPGPSNVKPLSLAAMAECLKSFDVPATVHGFRSTFRDWAGDATSFPRDVVEMALAHTVGDQTERAYRRGSALERRRELMSMWERYLSNDGANVVPLMRVEG